jgi:hypothetical protein
MKVRFQADADFNHIIIRAALRREPSIDFQTAEVAKLVGLEDEKVLGIAAVAGRVLLTHDRKTMPGHFAYFITKETSPGVIIVPQKLAISTAVDDLVLIWAASQAEEWIDRIQSLPL